MNARDSIAHASAKSVVTYREDYLPPTHRISWVRLDFTLGLDATRVVSEFAFERVGNIADLCLHGDELHLTRVTINGQDFPLSSLDTSPSHLRIEEAPEIGVIRIETELNPQANTALMGLYASRGGLFTQCESEGFRRITYFLDRPDVMATYDVIMRGPKDQFPVMLSNGNLVSERNLDNGLHEAHWQDPFPKPSYLFALVAADLGRLEETITTASGRKALLQVYTRSEDLGQADFALQSLKRAIFWDEQRFGLELDLERFMIVAVPDFNSGAMENKGLNLFNTKYVLADPQTATDGDYDGIESVVAHEYFHNWTGNRITCRDWFQLTLKEGLTVFRDSEFSSDMSAEGLAPEAAASARAVNRIESVRVLRASQFPEDAGPMAHPIRPDHYQEIRNFYTATVYEKGAEVIGMLQTILGRPGFRKGIDLYFARHDGQAVTCEDFVAAMFDANTPTAPEPDADSRQQTERFMRWYDTSGTPSISVSDAFDSSRGEYTLTFSQQVSVKSRCQNPLTVPIALGFIDPQGLALSPERLTLRGDGQWDGETLLLTGDSAQCRIACDRRPVPSLLRGFSAPVALHYPYAPDQLLHLLAHDSDPFNRWEAGQRVMHMVLVGSVEGADKACPVLDALAEQFCKALIDPSLSDRYKALLLEIPSEKYSASQLTVVDPGRLHQAWLNLRHSLSERLDSALHEIDQRCLPLLGSEYRRDVVSVGRRALHKTAQGWRLVCGTLSADELLTRYRRVSNMTDRFALLEMLVENGGPASNQAVEEFYQQFSGHDLALDKWFSIQAQTRHPSAYDRVCSLMKHPKFDLSNPNRVRALLGAFFHNNLAGFHRPDGQGYELWCSVLTELDSINSQISSRLARAMDIGHQLEPVRRLNCGRVLEEMESRNLSTDLREVIDRQVSVMRDTGGC